MKRAWLPIASILLATFSIINAMGEKASAVNDNKFFTSEEAVKAFSYAQKIDIKLLERIEVIEKKLKITPPTDSLKLVKAGEQVAK